MKQMVFLYLVRIEGVRYGILPVAVAMQAPF